MGHADLGPSSAACFPRASRDDPPFHYKGFGTQGFPRASRDDPDRLWGGV